MYLAVASVFAIFCFMHYNAKKNEVVANPSQSVAGLFLLSFYILFIGLRPVTGIGLSIVFGDTVNYILEYNFYTGSVFTFTRDTDNLIFDNLLAWWASVDIGITSFFFLCSLLYFGCAYWAIRKMFSNDSYAVFLVFLTAFSTYSASVNAVKAGVAGSLFLLAIAYHRRLFVSIPLVLLSLGFHHSMMVLVVAYVCCLFINTPKYYYYFWLFSLVMAIAHITSFQEMFASYTDSHGADYLLSIGEDWGGKSTGFRADFVLYSFMPLVMGWYAIQRRGVQDKLYNIILSTYVFTNSIWLLCMYAAFTNRIAYLSWFMYPVVLVYPCFLKQFGRDRYSVFAKVATLHLAFTLFMNLIYY